MPPLEWYGDPFWAPDSQSIAFQTVSGLMKNAGTKRFTGVGYRPCRPAEAAGATKALFFARALTRLQVASAYTVLQRREEKRFTLRFPDSRRVAITTPSFFPAGMISCLCSSPRRTQQKPELFIATLRDGKAIDPRLLFSNDTAAAFTSAGGGRILFVRNDNLYAQKLDVKARHLISDPELVQERVASNI